jgi:hypothetical protein
MPQSAACWAAGAAACCVARKDGELQAAGCWAAERTHWAYSSTRPRSQGASCWTASNRRGPPPQQGRWCTRGRTWWPRWACRGPSHRPGPARRMFAGCCWRLHLPRVMCRAPDAAGTAAQSRRRVYRTWFWLMSTVLKAAPSRVSTSWSPPPLGPTRFSAPVSWPVNTKVAPDAPVPFSPDAITSCKAGAAGRSVG